MYTVKQAAGILGISPHTIRYYDKRGLLSGVARDDAGSRLFDDDAIERMKAVVALREAGMPVAEIARFAALQQEGAGSAAWQARLLQCRANLNARAKPSTPPSTRSTGSSGSAGLGV